MERLVPGGLGLLRDDSGVVLLRGGLPGERVRARITRLRGGVRHGVVVDVFERSPARISPDCGLHPRCGGCDLLDLSAEGQAAAKREMVLDALRRIARLEGDDLERVAPLVRAPLAARARRRARLTVDDEGAPGFFAPGSHEVVALEDGCPALTAPLEEAARELADELELPPRVTLQLACDDDGRVSLAVGNASKPELRALAREAEGRGIVTGALVLGRRGQVVEGFGDPVLLGEVAPGAPGGPYRSDAATFTQATRFGGHAILDEVLSALGPLEGRRVLELFAGAGHLTLPMAAAGASVLAVEGDARAFHWLERNAVTGGLDDRVHRRRGFIEGGSVHALLEGEARFDALVLDPPRTGVPGFAAVLDGLEVDRLVMVSCDPATGARDLGIARSRGFVLERLVPIDAFPRTSHVEWVASLSRPPERP